MTLPRKVREQEELADRLQKEVYQSPAPPLGVVQNVNQMAQTPAQPVDNVEEQPPAPPEQQQEQQPPAVAPAEEDTWEHRYKVLSGKYSSEVPRFAAELRELKAKLEARESEVEALKKAPKEKPASLIRPEEIEEYGEGFVDLVRRAAKEEIEAKQAEVAELRAELNVVKQNSAKSVEVDFYTQLGQLVNDWAVVNDDQNFHRWLAEPDELTGIERQELLSDAEKARNANRVANFFLAYKRQAKQREAQANQNLAAQVVPATVSSSAPPEGKRYWTRGDIDRFYAAVRRNEMSDADAQRLEADINAAIIEGRIR